MRESKYEPLWNLSPFESVTLQVPHRGLNSFRTNLSTQSRARGLCFTTSYDYVNETLTMVRVDSPKDVKPFYHFLEVGESGQQEVTDDARVQAIRNLICAYSKRSGKFFKTSYSYPFLTVERVAERNRASLKAVVEELVQMEPSMSIIVPAGNLRSIRTSIYRISKQMKRKYTTYKHAMTGDYVVTRLF